MVAGWNSLVFVSRVAFETMGGFTAVGFVWSISCEVRGAALLWF